jgi:hypothetical protein
MQIIRITRMLDTARDQIDEITHDTHPELHRRVAARAAKAILADKIAADLYRAEQALWLYAKECKERQDAAQLLLRTKERKRTPRNRRGITATRKLAAANRFAWSTFSISEDTLEPYTKEEKARMSTQVFLD